MYLFKYNHNLYCTVFAFTVFFATNASFAESTGSAASNDFAVKLEFLLSNHPEILRLLEEKKEKASEANHRDTYPDPKIGFAYRSYPYRGGFALDRAKTDTPSMTGNEISLSQEIPYPGKLGTEKEIGKWESVETNFRAEWLQNRFLKNYFESKFKITALEREIKDLNLLGNLYRSLTSVRSSGFVSGKSGILPSLEASNRYNEIKDRLRERTIVLKEAETLVNYFESDFISENISPITTTSVEDHLSKKENQLKEGFESLSIEPSPELHLLQANVYKAEAIEKKNSILHFPDTEVFFSYMQRRKKPFMADTGPLNYMISDNTEFSGDLWSFGVTMRIPAWSGLDQPHLEQTSKHLKKKLRFEKETRRRELVSELKSAWEAWKGNKDRLDEYETKLLPSLKKTWVNSGASLSGEGSLGETIAFQIELKEAEIKKNEIYFNRWKSLIRILEITNHLLNDKENI
ncbi:TolC family protein [Leptospira sp. 'Mane']|uniref:TolC family protein n=1 Tax=Leptospira sp. 'Mane' TaxID=3387407 RepID=UPI00398B8CCE